MIEVGGQRGADLPKRQMRRGADDFIRRAALDFGQRVDVLNANARAGDERPRTTGAVGAEFDLGGCGGPGSI